MAIKHLCHLPIYFSQLGIVAVSNGGVGTIGSILKTLQSHGRLAVVGIGKAKEIVGQQSVVGCPVLIEERDVGLYVADSEGQAVTVTHINTVETGPHAGTVGLGGTTGASQQKNKDGQ